MFAPAHHGAMKHVGPARVELGTRTIFNLLGPCANPAGVTRQLLGVFSSRWLEPLVEVLGSLGSTRVLAVHGSDGLDEITTTGPTEAVLLDQGRITRFVIEPSDIGLDRASPHESEGRRWRAQCPAPWSPFSMASARPIATSPSSMRRPR